MTHLLFAATPVPGHVLPLATLANALHRAGHTVTFLCASRFADALAPGVRFVALEEEVAIESIHTRPERLALSPGPAMLDYDFRHVFAAPIPRQHAALQDLLHRHALEHDEAPLILLHDTCFLGAWPLALGALGRRPLATIGIGVAPLPISSVDAAPFGFGLPADATARGRARNAELNAQVRESFRGAQDALQRILNGCGATRLAPFALDAMVTLTDAFLQLGLPEFDYHRSDMPTQVRHIGALALPAVGAAPAWLGRLGRRPRVMVTQGTVANRDLGELIVPTLAALADLDVDVIAVTGRDDVAIAAEDIPDNAWVHGYVAFQHLLPHVDVMVSNGGYGGVLQALAHGVPLVLAGDTEDKVEVCARAAATGAAVNLRTRRPTPEMLRNAVLAVLGEEAFTGNARRLREGFARRDPVAAVESVLDVLSGRRRRRVVSAT